MARTKTNKGSGYNRHKLHYASDFKWRVCQAYLTAKIAQEKLKAAQKQVSTQQIAYDSAKDRYLEGLLHAIELNTFRINLEKAKSNIIQPKYEFYFRKTILDYYVKR